MAAIVFAMVPASAATSGYNDFTCKPNAAHPDPVVLLHGLGGNADGNVGPLALILAAKGYCTFAPTYGKVDETVPVGGTVDIDISAHEIASYIDRVLTATGASKVDIVGHSEGAFQSLYVPKVLGYAGKVGKVVALAPPTHGTTFVGLVTVAQDADLDFLVTKVIPLGCPACSELVVGGSAVKTLDNGAIAQPGVAYTIIASRTDALVVPHKSTLFNTAETAFVAESGVKNAYVQDTCPLDPVGHIGLAYDADVSEMVSNALDPAHAEKVTCSLGLPG
ncbi:alpha/beta fold hydrolase [Nocardia sp. CDC153]|uniref:esterase/lipase family protein n=1 Tax=Nocardia sp. CDC153 TaxID=3112167 RepID=UPI002DBD2E27|nr:alpha/beta fold hydrolase [Nocardia sp. CDC153]MEC3953174.1 alpha/beta fold hydrolase [Nocardia sp. CDC153]